MRFTTFNDEDVQLLGAECWRLLADGTVPLSDLTDQFLELAGFDFLRARLEQGRRIAMNSVGNPLAFDRRFYAGDVFVNNDGDDDQLIARVDVVLAGRVFTTQISAADAATDSLCLDNDLVAFDGLVCAVDDFTVNGEPGARTIDQATDRRELRGAPGWLERFPLGAMLTVAWLDRDVRVTLCHDHLEIGKVESDVLLSHANDERPGHGFLVGEPIMKQVVDDPAAYSSPVAPVTEMMRAVGFEHRGPWFGRSGTEWHHPDIAQELEFRAHVATKHDFADCCMDAFDELVELWNQHVAAVARSQEVPSNDEREALEIADPQNCPGPGPDVGYGRIARLLRHGNVADAFAGSVVCSSSPSAPKAGLAFGFLRESSYGDPHAVAAVCYLAGRVTEWLGRFDEATGFYESALAEDQSYTLPCTRLAWLDFDRSRFSEARRWLTQSGRADAHDFRFLPPRPAANDKPKRNDRCPCGSGRKYKVCHANQSLLSSWQRLQLKYDRHKAITNNHVRVQMMAFMSCDLDTEQADRFIGDQFLADVRCFEDDGLTEFATARCALFPDDEIALLDRLAESRRHIYEVTRVEGNQWWLRSTSNRGDPPETDVAAAVIGSASRVSVGDLIVARLVEVASSLTVIGEVLTIPPSAVDGLLEVLEAPPIVLQGEDLEDYRDRSCEDLVGWYVAEFVVRSASVSRRS